MSADKISEVPADGEWHQVLSRGHRSKNVDERFAYLAMQKDQSVWRMNTGESQFLTLVPDEAKKPKYNPESRKEDTFLRRTVNLKSLKALAEANGWLTSHTESILDGTWQPKSGDD